jgi:hypothetical protein
VKLLFLHECTVSGGIDVGYGLPIKVLKKKRKKVQEEKEEGKKHSRHKIVNAIKQVWQTVDSPNSRKKTQKGFNDRGVYAATTSIDHPYAEMGI